MAIKQKKPISVYELRRRRVLFHRGLLVFLLFAISGMFLLSQYSSGRWYDPENAWWQAFLFFLTWIYTSMYLGTLGMIGRLLMWCGVSRQKLSQDVTHDLFTNWRGSLSQRRSVRPKKSNGIIDSCVKSPQRLVAEQEEADLGTVNELKIDLREFRRFRVLLVRGLLGLSVLSLGIIGFMIFLLLVFPEFSTDVTDLWSPQITIVTAIYYIFGCFYAGVFLGTEYVLHGFAVPQSELRRDGFQNLFRNWREDPSVHRLAHDGS